MEILYGYLRITATSDAVRAAMEQRMHDFATARGFQLAKIYAECDPVTRAEFYRMFDGLQRLAVHHLVVPSINDLGDQERIRDLRLARLATTAAVEVHALDDPDAANANGRR